MAGPDALVGKHVIVPAVMPCGNCPICDAGRGNRCLAQKMPGNSLGIYGGFSSHIPVPAGDLCVVDEAPSSPEPLRGGGRRGHHSLPGGHARRAQAIGDLVIVTGITGGVGVYMGQIAKAMGAKVVVGIARNQAKLDRALNYGVDYVINSKDKDVKQVKGEFGDICKQAGRAQERGLEDLRVHRHRRRPGNRPGLLSFVGKMIVVGFGMQTNKYMLQAHGL